MKRITPRKLADIVASSSLLLAAVVLLTMVFPEEIPEGLKGDLSSGYYPGFIMTVWIATTSLWLLRSVFFTDGHSDDVYDVSPSRRSLVIALAIAIGFGIFAAVGFVAAATPLIAALAYICGERGRAPWILALTVPPSIYFLLDLLLDVRLPTIIFP